MTTSGTYSFYVTRDDIVREALLNIKKIDGIDPIDNVIMNDMVRKLNLICKQWMGKGDFAPGLKVWTRKRGHLFLHNSVGVYPINASYTGWATDYDQTATTLALNPGDTVVPVVSLTGMVIGDKVGIELDTGDLYWTTIASFGSLIVNLTVGVPSSSANGNVVFTYTSSPQQPLLIETALLRDSQMSDTPLNIMQSRDYDFLPNKVSPNNLGDPTAVYYENQLTYGALYTDVSGCQDVSKHIVLTFMEPVQDIVNSTDTPYYPQEWYRPLCWELAKEASPMFNAVWTPVMESLRTSALAIAQQKDPEIETRFFQCNQD